jgi:hypothetical protein
MSMDGADDLHALEDRIGLLESLLRRFLDEGPRLPITGPGQELRTAAENALTDEFCRPTCLEGKEFNDSDTDCGDEFCDCPCHHEED